jgi:hypothetical protein
MSLDEVHKIKAQDEGIVHLYTCFTSEIPKWRISAESFG